MKFLLLLVAAISAQTLSSIKDPPDLDRQLNRGQNYSEDVLHRTSAAVSFRRRFNRDVGDTNLETHVTNLKMVARITNGMSILLKSMHGSLEFEEFISEVLRFGDVKSNEIEKLDASKLEQAMNNLKSLPNDMTPTVELKDTVEKVEKVFDGLKKILDEVDGVGDITEWKDGKTDFFNEMDRLQNQGVPVRFIVLVDSAASNWNEHFPSLSIHDSTPTTEKLSNIEKALKNFKERSLSFDADTTFWSFNNFSTAVDGISPVLKAAKGVGVYDSVDKTLDMDGADESAYVQYVESVVGKLKDSLSRMDYVKTTIKLLTARAEENHKRKLEITIGLPNGASEFSLLSDDIEDSWIQKVIKTKSLKSLFNHFKGIGNHLKNIDRSIGGNLDRLEKMSSFLSSISNVLAELESTDFDIHQGRQCNRTLGATITVSTFSAFKQSLENIDRRLAELKNDTQVISNLVKTPGITKMCDDVIAICQELKKDGTNVQEVLKKFGDYKNMKTLSDHIQNVKEKTSKIISFGVNNVKSEATNVLKNNASLELYQNRTGNYAKYFKCIQSQDKLKSVFKTLDELKKIRGWSQNTDYSTALDDGSGVMNEVIGVKGDLHKLKDAMGVLEKLDTPEAKILKGFTAASTHAKNIGKAVQALAGMSLASSERKAIQNVVDNIPVVSTHKSQLTDTVDVTNLNALVGSSSEIGEMLKSLEDFKGTVGTFVSSGTFAEQSKIFENGKKVTGVAGDFSGMSESVGKLKKVVSGQNATKLNGVEAGLKTMDSLDLNFADFKTELDESKKSLADLDLFFASSFQTSVTLGPGQTPAGKLGNTVTTIGSQQVWTTTGVNKKQELSVGFIVGTSVAGFLIFFIIILIHFLCHKYNRRWLVEHYCIKWKATPEILFDIFYDHFKRIFDAMRRKEPRLKGEMAATCYSHFESAYSVDMIDADETFKEGKIVETDCKHPDVIWAENIPVLQGYGNRFANNFIHANICSFHNGKKWILTQPVQTKEGAKNCTVSKMFWLAKQKKTQSIVMFSDLGVCASERCARYYPETPSSQALNFGDLTVRCTDLKKPIENLEVRFLLAKFGDEKEFNLVHYKYTGLELTDNLPTSLDGLMFLYNSLEKNANPPIIHCSEGNRRTGLFTFAALLYDDLKHTHKVNFKTCLKKIRKLRVGAVSGAEDYSYGGRICWEMLAKKIKLDAKRQKHYEAYINMGFWSKGSRAYILATHGTGGTV